MRFRLLALFLLAVNTTTTAQTTIKLNLNQSFGSKALLYRFEGKQRIKVDSCSLNVNGDYQFFLPANAPQGQYRIQIGKSGTINLLVNNEPEIFLSSVAYAIDDSLKIVKSEENKAFISYLRLKHDKEQKEWLIKSLLDFYPISTNLGSSLRTELQLIESEFSTKALKLASDTNLLATSYINLDIQAYFDKSAPCNTSIEATYSWWNGVDLTKASLLNTPLLEKSLWNYIENLQCDSYFDKEQQDSIFVSNINNLLNKPMASQIRKLFIGSLCLGFAESDYYSVIEYLINNGAQYANPITDDADAMKRIELENNIKIGNKVNDFSFMPLNQTSKLKLSEVKGQYKLLVFWSAWCPHCVEMLPELKKLYEQYKNQGLEIIGISVDVDDQALLPFVEEKALPWINTMFTKKNEEKLSNSFNVDGTPKMVLLDKNLKVLSKPISVNHLRNKLNKLITSK